MPGAALPRTVRIYPVAPGAEALGGRPTRGRPPFQSEDQVAYGGWLGEERVTTPYSESSSPGTGFRRTATTDGLAPLEDGMRSLGRPELATVVPAVIRGLLQDLDATGDTVRTDRAFTDFLTMIGGP